MKYTKQRFEKDFPDDDACLDQIMEMRYGRQSTCPKCQKDTKFHRITGRKQYACQYCGYQIAPCAGTVFEKSPTPLKSWFYAMYLFTASRHGVPAKELERHLGVTYKCAWRIAHQLRKLMMQTDGFDPLSGHVEIDETFIGGKTTPQKVHIDKTVVFGMLERGGNVRAGAIANVKRKTIAPIIKRHVTKGATVSTDEHRTYHHLTGAGYQHGIVKHGHYEFVKGIHHVNNLECFWSRLKNSIRGTHIHVSQKHMSKYVAEFAFKYNNRKAPEFMFYRLLSGLTQPAGA